MLNTLTELDMNRIVAGKTAWINVSREFVLDDLIQAVPPSVVGLEIPETERFDDEMVDALRDLKRAGYRLALDDFRYRDGSEEVLDLFDVVKLSMPELGRQGMRELVARLRPYPGLVLADKLGTRPDHEVCIAAGCDLFQGYFFCRPAVVGTRGIAANRLALLQVVATLNDPAVELSDIEQLVVRDVALSFRLLRYVNSAFFGLRGDVRSIGQALALLGLENVRRWATLSTLASIDNKPTELTLTALIRARFCELAGGQLGIASPRRAVHARPVLGDRRHDGRADARRRRVAPAGRGHPRGARPAPRADGPAARLRGLARDRRGRPRPGHRSPRRRAVPRGADVGQRRPPSRCSAHRARRRRARPAPAGPLPPGICRPPRGDAEQAAAGVHPSAAGAAAAGVKAGFFSRLWAAFRACSGAPSARPGAESGTAQPLIRGRSIVLVGAVSVLDWLKRSKSSCPASEPVLISLIG